MRILVIIDDPVLRDERMAALERIESPAVGGCESLRLMLDVRSLQPDVLFLDGFASPSAARQALQRARDVSERRPVALLLLPSGSTWLRTPLPPDVRPATVLPVEGFDDEALARALASMKLQHAELRESAEAHDLHLELKTGEAVNDRGRVKLSAPETTLLRTLLDQPTTVVRLEDLSRALTGHPLSDPRTRAMIHAHMESLRRKLGTIEAGDQIEALRTMGYRFVAAQRRPVPRRPARPRPPGR